MHEGLNWRHHRETHARWEEWSIRLSDNSLVEVLKHYKATPMPPCGGVDQVVDQWVLRHGGVAIAYYPLTTPLEEVLALAVTLARLK